MSGIESLQSWNPTFEEFLLKLGLGDLNLDGTVDLLLVAALVIGVILNSGREEGVDEGSLSQSRLSGNLSMELVSRQWTLLLNCKLRHTMIVNAAPRFATILCLKGYQSVCLSWSNLSHRLSSREYAPLVGELHGETYID